MSLKNYKINRELDRGEVIKAFGYTLILAIFFGMVLFYICQCIFKVRIENEVNGLMRTRSRLIQINHNLRLERGSKRALGYIDEEARNRLGLMDPKPNQMIFLKTNSVKE